MCSYLGGSSLLIASIFSVNYKVISEVKDNGESIGRTEEKEDMKYLLRRVRMGSDLGNTE